LLAALAAACGRDAAGPDQARLSQETTLEIASALFAELFATGFVVEDGAWPGDDVPAGAPLFNLMPTQEISVTGPCELGGSISFEGTITDEVDEQGNGRFAMDVRETPQDCVVATSEGQFTVNGDPNLRITVDLTVPEDVEITAIAMSISGGFRWNGQPGSGRCGVDVTITVNVAEPEAATAAGRVCGYDVSA